MRVPGFLLVSCIAACASKRTPAPAPAQDAALGGPQHHCADPGRRTAEEETLAAAALPIRDDALDPEERERFEAARPVFARYCLRCHSDGSKKVKPTTLEQLDMTTYPFASRHGATIARRIRTVVGLEGGAPSMPLVGRGCVPAADLDRIAAWAEAYDRAHAGSGAPQDP